MESLTERAQRWPWRWLPILQEAVRIAETESEQFRVLNKEHVSLLLKVDQLSEQRSESAECLIALESDLHTAKQTIEHLNESNRLLEGKISDLENERKADARALDVLKSEHHFLRLENTELQKQRVAEAEKHQQLRDDYQLLKHEMVELQKENLRRIEAEQVMKIKADALEEERVNLMERCKRAEDGLLTTFGYIRRNKIISDNGQEIPEITRFPDIFNRRPN